MSGGHGGNSHKHSPYIIFFVIFYTLTALGLLYGSIFIGGPITAGWCPWGLAVLLTLFLYVIFSGSGGSQN